MDVAIITVGDEILAGDIENTNATWIASQLTDRGVAVKEIITIPDVLETITWHVGRCSDEYDGVIVTGGIGGTPDDKTMRGVADAFGVAMQVNDRAYDDVTMTLEEIHERRPDLALDVEAEASIPADARPLINSEGISPGCVIENVFVLPGIPSEMKAMFGDIAEQFVGNLYSETTYTNEPESNIAGLLERVGEQYDVGVGCYPNEDGPKRIKVTAEDKRRLQAAFEHLTEELDTEPMGVSD
jgi:molybdenum cofactor synthesis domain-containing protein